MKNGHRGHRGHREETKELATKALRHEEKIQGKKINALPLVRDSLTMDDEYPPDYIKKHYKVFDRFTFDDLFKRLLADGCGHDDAKDVIMYNCAMSALVLQERIHNEYYSEMCVSDTIAPDLLQMYREEFIKAVYNQN